MAGLSFPNDSIHRLKGTSGTEKGGLIIMKKGPANDSSQHTFKVPQVSLLGLDKLAAAKRKAQYEENDKKKSKVRSYRDDSDEDAEDDSDDEKDKHKDKKDRLDKQEGR